jgi:outer membrane protein OmpA-like peptidoglycan-associated protein
MDRFIHCRRGRFLVNLTGMRHLCLLLTALFGAGGPVLAQVTVDLHALDGLPGAKPAAKVPAMQSSPLRRVSRPTIANSGQAPQMAKPPAATEPKVTTATPSPATPQGTTAAPSPITTGAPSPAPSPSTPQIAAATPSPTATPAVPPPATLPTTPPPTAALVPVTPPPAAQPAAPPPPPISESAASSATNAGAGLRVTFGAGQSDLSPASAAAIKGIVQSAQVGETVSFNVVAYAAGTPDDPSTARRLSLSRALAVRSALMADGVNSSRIYVRALGAAGGSDEPDRVDLAVMGTNAPGGSPAAARASDGGKSQSP